MCDGHSTTRPIPTDPLCSEIVTDRMIVTAANGDELWLVNSGEDCLDFSVPGHTFIRCSGTFNVAGGTGRFRGATGSGQFAVVAEVTGFVGPTVLSIITVSLPAPPSRVRLAVFGS